MPNFAKFTAAACSVSILVLAGCGGGSGGDSKKFTSDAAAICKNQTAQLQAIGEPSSEADLAPYLDKVAAFTRANRDKLAKLDPPSSKKSGFKDYIAALDAQLAKFDKTRAAAHAGKTAEAVQMIKDAQTSGNAVKARAKALGLTECAA